MKPSQQHGRRLAGSARGTLVLALTAGVLLAQAPVARSAGSDWNQWRGPARDGKIPGFQAPAQWPKQLTRRWSVEVGSGHASPLIVGDAAYVFAREIDEEVIRRLDLATGKQVWRDSYPAPYTMHPAAVAHGKGPKSTPVLAGGMLYTLGISGVLSCLDAQSGKVVWRHDFKRQYPKTSPAFGAAMSPLVADGLLIAHVGGANAGALTAFDARTGQERWKWTGDGPAYSSPLVVEVAGVQQVVTQSQRACICVALQDGRLLWQIPFTTAYDQNSVSPVQAGDLLVFGGMRQPTFACRLKKEGDTWTPERVWESREATFYLSTPVASGGKLYGMSERRSGEMVTLEAATGKLLWSGPERFGANAAVLDGGPVLLVLTTAGELHVLRKAGDTLEEAARYKVSDTATWASPAVSGNRILIKDLSNLTLWEIAS